MTYWVVMDQQHLNETVINLRRLAAEHFQKAAWNQLLALDNYRENNLAAAERFAQLSFDEHMTGADYAELADAEVALLLDLEKITYPVI